MSILLKISDFNIAENRIHFPQSFSLYPNMKDYVLAYAEPFVYLYAVTS